MKMYLSESWQDRPQKIEVLNPFDGTVVDTVPRAEAIDVEKAIRSAWESSRIMRRTSGYDRYVILKRAAEMLEQRSEELARTITLEEGKVIAEARFEVSRAVQVLLLSGEEAKRLGGEVLPLDGSPGAGIGWVSRCGSLAAWWWRSVLSISP